MNAAKHWTRRTDLHEQLEKLWDRGMLLRDAIRQWRGEKDAAFFPKRLVFKTPDSRSLSDDFDAVRQWIAATEKIRGFRIEYRTVRHRVIGENSLPDEAWIDSLDDAILVLQKMREREAFETILSTTAEQLPELLPWLERYPLKALALVQQWPLLLRFVSWRQSTPDPGIYLRQVSLPGINSKFIEQHRGVLAQLLDLALDSTHIDQTATGARQFAQRYGFRSKPERIRFRLLDQSLSFLALDDTDISLTVADFIRLGIEREFDQNIQRVFITENEINFLSFPIVENSLILFGSGYGFEALSEIDWLRGIPVFYWGDIDTHGFAILNQLRKVLPHVQSLLMDECTLLENKPFWGRESSPSKVPLARLNDEEQRVYQALINNMHEARLRLEQEHIDLGWLRHWLESNF